MTGGFVAPSRENTMVTLVDTTLLPAARRAPGKPDKNGGHGAAGDTVKGGVPHSGYQAPVAVDQKHTLIRQTTLTAAPVPDRREFEAVGRGDEERVVADQAYWSPARSPWGGERGLAKGILRKPSRGEKLRAILEFRRVRRHVRIRRGPPQPRSGCPLVQ